VQRLYVQHLHGSGKGRARWHRVHLTSGLEFSDLPVVFVSHTPNVVILQGYLIASREE